MGHHQSREYQSGGNYILKIPVRKRKGEAGQALVLVVVGMSLFLLGALGLAVDGSHLYAQRQMAQAAADAAAQAGIMSIFDGTSGAWGAHTAGATFTCTAGDTATPCQYAQSLNGFNGSSDTVTVTPNPTGITVPNLSPTTDDPVNLLKVTVTRSVPTTLIRFLGPSASQISASGTAAIVAVTSPVPILITHPSLSNALSMNGTTGIKICGGSQQSIEINSSASDAYTGGGTVDLSRAGPADTSGTCTPGTGGDFGVWGGQSTRPSAVSIGSTGHYIQPSSPVRDPLAGVYPVRAGYPNGGPPVPAAGTTRTISNGTEGCTLPSCKEYSPGLYVGGISETTNNTMEVFKPGLYYIQGGGFKLKNTTAITCPVGSCTSDPNTGTGMVIYNSGLAATPTDAGVFNIDTGVTAKLRGANLSNATPPAAPTAPYYGILFFQDRTSVAHYTNNDSHTFGQGNGCFDLVGTIYTTNTQQDATHYQLVTYNGNPCSSTIQQGEIIVSALQLVGTTNINMQLYPTTSLKVRQVALVN